MKTPKSLYLRHRSPSEIIQYAVWLYHRFSLSLWDVEDLLVERGVTVSYETLRRWGTKFGPRYANRLRQRYGQNVDTWHVEDVFVRVGFMGSNSGSGPSITRERVVILPILASSQVPCSCPTAG